MHFSRWFLLLFTLLLLSPGSAAAPSAPIKPAVLRVALKASPPFVIREGANWRGVAVDLWHDISLDLRQAYVYQPYHSVEEVLSAVASGKADLAIGALSVNAEREARLDFSQPYFQGGVGIVTAKQADSVVAGLLAIFNWSFVRALAALATVLLCVGLLIWLLERKRNPEQFGAKGLAGIGEGFWWAAVTMTTVGYGDKAPSSPWGRLVGVIWMFISVITISSFTAAITSNITLSNLQNRVQGAEDLAKARIGAPSGTSSSLFLNQRSLPFETYDTVEESLDLLEQNQLDAVVYDLPILRYLLAGRGSSNLVLLSDNLHKEHYAFALPEGSPLREPLNRALLKITDSPRWPLIQQSYFQSSP